jgi:hypothetical protein
MNASALLEINTNPCCNWNESEGTKLATQRNCSTFDAKHDYCYAMNYRFLPKILFEKLSRSSLSNSSLGQLCSRLFSLYIYLSHEIDAIPKPGVIFGMGWSGAILCCSENEQFDVLTKSTPIREGGSQGR